MLGHSDVGVRLNVRRELRRITRNPLEPYLRLAFPESDPGGLRSRYEEAFQLYALAMERALEQVSTTVRFRKGPYYVVKYGGSYGPRQRLLAEKHRRLRRFLELDIITCFIQTRTLLDRTIALPRRFLTGAQLPSFTSFADHRSFFVNGRTVSGHEAYGKYMREQTSWFDIPIKFPRDKLFVHQGPRHTKFFGIPGWGVEDDLVWYVLIPDKAVKANSVLPEEGGQRIRLNVLRLSYDIDSFLRWFATYGRRAMRKERRSADS